MNRPDQPDPYDGEGHGRGSDDDRHPGHRTPRIPAPRSSVEDSGLPLPEVPAATGSPHSPVEPEPPVETEPKVEPEAPVVPEALVEPEAPVGHGLDHDVLKSLLGAWALSACSAPEAIAVEEHLGTCGPCAEEALRLRDAVGLLHPEESLDLDPRLRTRVLESCLGRRPPRIPLPEWAAPYDAETARLDALLQDIGDAEWHAPVRLRWFEGDVPVSRKTTVAGVIAHLLAVDGLVGAALGLTDPLGPEAPPVPHPTRRTETFWSASRFPPTRAVREPWRDQTHELIRTVSFAGGGSGRLAVEYGVAGTATAGGADAVDDEGGRTFAMPLRDSMVERAFECWIHAEDIAEAVDYPYEPPSPRHLHHMIDLAARMLPATLAERRRAGRAAPSRELVVAGAPGRSLRLEVEGVGGGEWFIPLDSPGASGSAECEVAHIALDGVEFCRLAAGHVAPEEAAAGQVGDREAIRDVLFAAASLSRL
ncbi:zf-HC2 domain-containing protein [Streptomyces aureocirculatus]|uniref:zf-HC2 domain-containing protein n=1 Tax=Streptomyces aureocirculatus TaxID=67275 RepID=UPI0004CBA476|nr:zf-HC2 domain-containing protein [Streptomyces aureocirculatus]